MRESKAIIKVDGISKYFGPPESREYALREVSLDVNQGEMLMLVGPSGSGKTTLLSIMGCILQASSGRLVVAGEDVAGLSTRQLGAVRLSHIGFIFQEYNLFPTLDCLDNLMVALHLRGIRRREARDRGMESLEVVGLADRAHSMPDTMSGGQKQRLAIARALVGRPQVILADEPTAALDSVNGKNVVGIMADLAHRSDCAVVVVTHDQRAMGFADRIVTIEDGRLKETL